MLIGNQYRKFVGKLDGVNTNKGEIILILFFLLLFADCRQIKECDKKEVFTISRQNYLGTQIKTDGYYYSDLSMPKIFYRNGVLHPGSVNYRVSNTQEIETQIISGVYYNKIKEQINQWSIYQINNNEIKYELFTRKGELDCWYSIIVYGTILNDTTIEFTKIINSDGTESKNISDIWHFKQFSPKPDSTNSFIQ